MLSSATRKRFQVTRTMLKRIEALPPLWIERAERRKPRRNSIGLLNFIKFSPDSNRDGAFEVK